MKKHAHVEMGFAHLSRCRSPWRGGPLRPDVTRIAVRTLAATRCRPHDRPFDPKGMKASVWGAGRGSRPVSGSGLRGREGAKELPV